MDGERENLFEAVTHNQPKKEKENTMKTLTPLKKVVANPSGWDSLSNYMGEIPGSEWLCVMTRNRDSDCLTESNWRTALEMLGGESESVQIDRFGHWACGWWESLSVKDGTPSVAIAEKIKEKMDSYPVLDEEDFMQLESQEADKFWKSWSNKERINYIREHYSEMTFHSFADLLSSARGDHFAGYAGDLLN